MQSTRTRAKLGKQVQLKIFKRDRWLCHWCKRPVIFGPVLKFLQKEVKDAGVTNELAYHHAHWTRSSAPLLDELGAVLDHVEAFASGGACQDCNLVTSCAKCNGRKSDLALQQWEQRDKRTPIKGKYGEPQLWDGLSTVFAVLAQRHSRALSSDERAWLRALQQQSKTGEAGDVQDL